MHDKQISLFSVLVIIFGIIALAITIFAITQSTEFKIKAERGAVLLLSGNPLEVRKGDTFIVNLDIQTNTTPVQTVFINLTFPTRKLNLSNTNTSHSPFDFDAGSYSSNGYLTIGRSTGFPRSGNIHIATLTFLAKENVSLKDIQAIPGTSILNTENRNIYLQTVTTTSSKTENSPSVIQFFVDMVESLFSKQKK